MRRIAFAILILVTACPVASSAADWAPKMFNTTTHDFGTVARGAKAVFRFEVKNIFKEDVHLASVRSSCGCTTPQIVKPDLKTFEVGEVVAELDTVKFLGHRQATLTVLIDKPYRAEVQLNIQAFIRGDVVLQPGEVDFGTIESGVGAERKIAVSYAGRGDWRIVDAQSANPNFEVELVETARQQGKVAYDLLVRLTKDAPVGYVHDQLMLITSDAQARQLPVDVTGRIMPSAAAITVSPAPLWFGKLHPGDKVTKKLMVRSKKPFKIVDIKCDDDAFEANMTSSAKQMHWIPITFTAKEQTGRISRQIAIETDQNDTVATFTAYAEIVGGEADKSLDLTSPADQLQPADTTGESAANTDSTEAQEDSPVEAERPVEPADGPVLVKRSGATSTSQATRQREGSAQSANPLRSSLEEVDSKKSPLPRKKNAITNKTGKERAPKIDRESASGES